MFDLLWSWNHKPQRKIYFFGYICRSFYLMGFIVQRIGLININVVERNLWDKNKDRRNLWGRSKNQLHRQSKKYLLSFNYIIYQFIDNTDSVWARCSPKVFAVVSQYPLFVLFYVFDTSLARYPLFGLFYVFDTSLRTFVLILLPWLADLWELVALAYVENLFHALGICLLLHPLACCCRK